MAIAAAPCLGTAAVAIVYLAAMPIALVTSLTHYGDAHHAT